MPGLDFILCWEDLCFPRSYGSGLTASVLRFEVELGTEPRWLWEKQVNDFAASVKYCPEGTARGPSSTLLLEAGLPPEPGGDS